VRKDLRVRVVAVLECLLERVAGHVPISVDVDVEAFVHREVAVVVPSIADLPWQRLADHRTAEATDAALIAGARVFFAGRRCDAEELGGRRSHDHAAPAECEGQAEHEPRVQSRRPHQKRPSTAMPPGPTRSVAVRLPFHSS
jgi:hypothetical protein